jgi:hypothetical protein
MIRRHFGRYTMPEHAADQIQVGMLVHSPDGLRSGKVVGVNPDPPDGTMASAIGYIEVEEQLPDRVRIIHVPLTEVLAVRPDGVVAELDPDIVAAHDKQWFPENPVRKQ